MENQKQLVKQLCSDFRISAVAANLDQIIATAESEDKATLNS